MFLDPDKLGEAAPAEILEAAAKGHLGIDHRFLHALLDRPAEALPDVLAFAQRDRTEDVVDLAPELIALLRSWKTSEGVPFLVRYIKEDPQDVPDEAIEALVEIGQPALEPLLALYGELDESESGEVAFILANLRARDERVLKILLDRLEYDLSDTVLLLGIYGDPAGRPALEKAAAELGDTDQEIRKEIADALESLSEEPPDAAAEAEPTEPFDIWLLYPKRAGLPLDLLDEDARTELVHHPLPAVRAAAANSFFNQELTEIQQRNLLQLATHDGSVTVRARAWEALTSAVEDTEVLDAMLGALRNPGLLLEERAGLLVGLAPEADRNEVRNAIVQLYGEPEWRAKALEAMWRSLHPSFRGYFANHLDDPDLETRRGALWGVGYYGLKSELDRVRRLFEDEDLRSDALFAYALAMPAEVSRGRMKGLLARIERDAHGLSEIEEELVKTALDERLMLAGKEPVFAQQED
ncbi:MAG TPA: hypothetical protein VHU83_17680 [Bryobacteraceae bacterium]|jgi:hypothetical protein|nr:hypothetical protein [Bryobacteraceae bacterium]